MEHLLKPLRERIDAVDTEIQKLLNERAKIVQEVGEVKAKTNSPIFRPDRETQILRRIAEKNPGPLSSESIQAIYKEIMSACRSLERKITVAYLGPAGTYSEQAAIKQFGSSINFLPCATIDEVFRSTESGAADFGVVPIENSTEGAINRTLDLLLNTPLKISSEVSIDIAHNLMTKSGTMDGVKTICAHSQALAQCQGWLNAHYPNLPRTAVSSNGMAADMASKDPTVAAIAGEGAAYRYGLTIVSAKIQDEAQNRTRFAIIGTQETAPTGHDQTTLVVTVKNVAGSVYRMLAPFAYCNVSMTRLESRPAKNGNWEYYFFVDLVGHVQDANVTSALQALTGEVVSYKVLGSYPI